MTDKIVCQSIVSDKISYQSKSKKIERQITRALSYSLLRIDSLVIERFLITCRLISDRTPPYYYTFISDYYIYRVVLVIIYYRISRS